MRTYGKGVVYIPNAPVALVNRTPILYGTSLGLKQGRYILFASRLVPEKCPDLLIKTNNPPAIGMETRHCRWFQ